MAATRDRPPTPSSSSSSIDGGCLAVMDISEETDTATVYSTADSMRSYSEFYPGAPNMRSALNNRPPAPLPPPPPQATTMSFRSPWWPPPPPSVLAPRRYPPVRHEAAATCVGLLGAALSAAVLAAYGVLQIDGYRRKILPPYTIFTNDSVRAELYRPGDVLYATEAAVVAAVGIIGLLVNAMLVLGAGNVGTGSGRAACVAPWLAAQALLTAACLAGGVVAVVAAVGANKAFSAIPFVIAAVSAIFWIIVLRFFLDLRRVERLKRLHSAPLIVPDCPTMKSSPPLSSDYYSYRSFRDL